MCGIFGYVRCAKKKTRRASPVDVCLNGLKLLEYRGYDSSGIAGMTDGKLLTRKKAGKVGALAEAVASENLTLNTAIAHTRWATHGAPSQENAHPQLDENETLALVHNGIIENYHVIRKRLASQGTIFTSDTDTEVIAALIASYYAGDLKIALQKALKELHGSFAIALIHKDHPDEILGASRESPLVIGINHEKKEAFLSSDANSFNGMSLDIAYLKDDEIVILKPEGFEVFDEGGVLIDKPLKHVDFKDAHISKNGYDHYMLKEIFEQPQTIQNAMMGRFREEFGTAHFEELTLSPQYLQSIHRVLILGCGTSWHAGLIAASMLEGLARIPTEVEIASEFRYTNPIISDDTLVLAISQSGETADTIAAVREARVKGAKVISICNVDHSTLVRESDSSLFLKAGPEVSVCSTKAFTSQLTVLALFSLYMARLRHLSKEEGQAFLKELKHLPTKITQVLAQGSQIESYAEKYADFEDFFFMGRRHMFPTSLEAALKLKEISYLNAQGYPAGEMKHGPIALVCHELAVIGMCGNMQTFDKTLSNLMEVKARGGAILAFAPKGKEEILNITRDVLWLPQVIDPLATILYSVAGQLFAYYIAKLRGTDIDQPRNLAKSVTVE